VTQAYEDINLIVASVDGPNGVVYVRSATIELDIIDVIFNASYYTKFSSGADRASDYYINYSEGLFYINRNYFNDDPAQDLVTASYRYYGLVSANLFLSNPLGDGSPYTQVEYYTISAPSNATAMIVSLTENTSIDAIDIGCGFFYPKETADDVRKYNIQMTLTLQYSESVMFSGICWQTISATDTNLNVTSLRNLSALSPGDTIVMEGEECTVNTITDNGYSALINVTRGVNGTTAQDHSIPGWGGYPDLFVSMYKKITFTNICTELTSFDITSGSYLAVAREALGDDFTAATFKFILNKSDAVTYTTAAFREEKTVYPFAIHTFKAYTNAYLSSEAILVTGTPANALQLQDGIGLLSRVGDRVYKYEFDEKVILSQSDLDTTAINFLTEFYKLHTQLRVQELYNPSLEMGLTALVVDAVNGINQNYFIEEISGTLSGGKVSHDALIARYP
jgi:hypothetical protein